MALLPVFISCHDDDGEGGGNDVPVSAPLVTSTGYYDYTYDKNGRVTGAFGDHITYLIDYTKGTIREIEDEYDETYDAKFNSNGTIKEFSNKYGTVTCSYNKQGYLTSINEKNDIAKRQESLTFTWNDDNLTEVKYSNDDFYGENLEYCEFFILYSSTENIHKQFPFFFAWDAIEMPLGLFSVTGLLGPGPANFPSSYRCIGAADYGTFRYTLNSQGAIKREYFTWEDDDEEYADYSYDSSRSEKTITTHKPGKHRRLFRFGHHE